MPCSPSLGDAVWHTCFGFTRGWGKVGENGGVKLVRIYRSGVSGSFLFGLIGLAAYGLLARLVMAVVGAVVLL
jgi:hypothetical protein